mmetsp:Transcript_40486/g.96218  ORF Transcript_40486/g.96218 Transcript_40486/m.96218 type:complete len:301 (-) Transcript_40486:646-1548(-)
MRRPQLADHLRAVEPRVVTYDAWDGAESRRERLHGEALLPGRLGCELIDHLGHLHLGPSAAVDDAAVDDGLAQHAERVVERALRLVEDVRRGAAEHDGAGLRLGDAAELDELILPDHHLFDDLAFPEGDVLRIVERRRDFAAGDKREPLDALKVRVLDCHHARVRKQLLREVVDQLTVDEAVDAVVDDLLHLVPHLVLLRGLDIRHLLHRLRADPRAVDLNLVRVHGGVGDEDLGILDALRLPDPDLLVQDEPLVQEGLLEGPARALDDLDGLEVRGALQAQHGVHGEGREVVLVLREDL